MKQPICLTSVQISCECSYQSAGDVDLVNKWPFCDVLITAAHSIQLPYETAPRMNHFQSTSVQGQYVSLGCRYHAYVQTKVRGSAGRQDSGQLWQEVKTNAQSGARIYHMWVKPDIRTAQSNPYGPTVSDVAMCSFSC